MRFIGIAGFMAASAYFVAVTAAPVFLFQSIPPPLQWEWRNATDSELGDYRDIMARVAIPAGVEDDGSNNLTLREEADDDFSNNLTLRRETDDGSDNL